ncbi:MAG: CoA transferase [Chloroflexi bacterium]|nr:CoA transferase [Chloroflexota bacterium]
MLPLDGIKVLDFSQAAFGPVATRLLGDLGADVIKVEPLEGDFTRLTALREGDSITFLGNNRSKRSLAVNLRDPRGKEIVLKLVEGVDVLVQNFRPGVMKRMGLDYEAVVKLNPRIIYGSFHMFGDTGPMARWGGADPPAQAFTGVVASQGEAGKAPYMTGHPFLDYGGAALNAFAIVTALLMRERTGIGQEVTNSLTNVGMYMQQPCIDTYLLEGVLYKKGGRGSAMGRFPYGAYTAADGDVVTIAGQDDDEWQALCSILGLEHLLADPRYDTNQKRVERRSELYPVLDGAFKKKTRSEWESAFRQNGLFCYPCLDYAEFLAHPQVEANDMVSEVNHPRDGRLRMVNVPVKFRATGPVHPSKPPPVLGEHTREVLHGLGYADPEIDRLGEEGVVGLPTPDMFQRQERKNSLLVTAFGRKKPIKPRAAKAAEWVPKAKS